MKTKKRFIEPLVGLLVMLALVGGLTWFLSEPDIEFIQGEVEATQIDLAVKVAGRVSNVWVKEGQFAEKGALLLDLDMPEIHAKLKQAAAAKEAASARRDKAFVGARSQELLAAKNLWLQAIEAADLAENTFYRIERLHNDGVIPSQRHDEARAKWRAAQQAAEAARAQYELAMEGAREEDRRAAAALAEQAGGSVSEVQSLLRETELKAPISGEVVHVLAEPGELVSPGYPVVTILDITDTWVTFNIREDNLSAIRMGRELTVTVPALGSKKISVKVSYISPLGGFATWRSTSASGGFDLKTFEVRAQPIQPVDGLRPGMSVLLSLSELNHERG